MPSGGRREGSGRKAVTDGTKRVQMMITISPDTRDRLKAIAKDRGESVGRFIDTLIMTDNYEKE